MNPVQKISNYEIAESAIETYILSINLRIDGLSFLIRNRQQEDLHMEQFEWLNVKDWNQSKKNLSDLLSSHALLKHNFAYVQIFIQSTESFLIPDSLFSESKIKSLYNTYYGISNHFIFSTKMKKPTPNAHMVFGLDKEIVQVINNKWKQVSWYHYSAFYLNVCHERSRQTQEVFVKLQQNYFEVVALMDQKLNAHNYFEFSNAEEFIFNLLSFIRQIDFDTEKLQLHLEGKITLSSVLHQLVKKYIPNLQFEAISTEKTADAFHELIQTVDYAHR